MQPKIIAFAATCLTALLTGAGLAIAEQAGSTQKVLEEIVVVAPRTLEERQRLPFGRGEKVTMSVGVNYDDLDLTKTADARELESRISEAAEAICEVLETRFPEGEPSRRVCVREATNKAMADAQKAIDAAIAGH